MDISWTYDYPVLGTKETRVLFIQIWLCFLATKRTGANLWIWLCFYLPWKLPSWSSTPYVSAMVELKKPACQHHIVQISTVKFNTFVFILLKTCLSKRKFLEVTGRSKFLNWPDANVLQYYCFIRRKHANTMWRMKKAVQMNKLNI